MNTNTHPLDHEQYVSLVTYRKNGTPVSTPVWFATDSAKLYVYSELNAGKIKRIRSTSKVEVAACTLKGKVTGPVFAGTAIVLNADRGPFVHGLLNSKYTWKKRLFEFGASIGKIFKKDKGSDAFIEITLA